MLAGFTNAGWLYQGRLVLPMSAGFTDACYLDRRQFFLHVPVISFRKVLGHNFNIRWRLLTNGHPGHSGWGVSFVVSTGFANPEYLRDLNEWSWYL